MVPPDFSKMGRNFRRGSKTNFSFAKNFAIKTPTTAMGAKDFFIRLQAVSVLGGSYCALSV
jgi:hypothetical protein